MNREPIEIGGIAVPAGRRKDIKLRISEQVTAAPVFIPVTVFHGSKPGPRVFILAAIHGDELSSTESFALSIDTS